MVRAAVPLLCFHSKLVTHSTAVKAEAAEHLACCSSISFHQLVQLVLMSRMTKTVQYNIKEQQRRNLVLIPKPLERICSTDKSKIHNPKSSDQIQIFMEVEILCAAALLPDCMCLTLHLVEELLL